MHFWVTSSSATPLRFDGSSRVSWALLRALFVHVHTVLMVLSFVDPHPVVSPRVPSSAR